MATSELVIKVNLQDAQAALGKLKSDISAGVVVEAKGDFGAAFNKAKSDAADMVGQSKALVAAMILAGQEGTTGFAQAQAQLAAAAGNAKAIDDALKKAGTGLGDTMKSAGDVTVSAADKFKAAFADAGKTALGVFGGELLTKGIDGLVGSLGAMLQKGVDAKKAQEDLAVGFRTAGVAAEDVSGSLKLNAKNVSELSDTYGVSKGNINAATTAYLKFGGSVDNLKGKQALLAALAEKTGMSYEQAGKMFAKATDPESVKSLNAAGIYFGKNATEAEKMKVATEALAPVMDQMKEKALGPIGSFERFQRSLGSISTAFGTLAIDLFSPLLVALGSVSEVITSVVGSIKSYLGDLMPILQPILIAVVAIGMAFALYGAIPPIIAAIGGSFGFLGEAAAGAWAAVTGPVGLTIIGLAAIGGAIYAAYQYFPPFKAIVDDVFAHMKIFWEAAIPSLKEIGSVIWEVGKFLFDFFTTPLQVVYGLFKKVFDAVFSTTTAVADGGEKLKTYATTVKSFFDGVLSVAQNVKSVVAGITGGFDALRNVAVDLFAAIAARDFSKIATILVGATDSIKKGYDDAAKASQAASTKIAADEAALTEFRAKNKAVFSINLQQEVQDFADKAATLTATEIKQTTARITKQIEIQRNGNAINQGEALKLSQQLADIKAKSNDKEQKAAAEKAKKLAELMQQSAAQLLDADAQAAKDSLARQIKSQEDLKKEIAKNMKLSLDEKLAATLEADAIISDTQLRLAILNAEKQYAKEEEAARKAKENELKLTTANSAKAKDIQDNYNQFVEIAEKKKNSAIEDASKAHNSALLDQQQAFVSGAKAINDEMIAEAKRASDIAVLITPYREQAKTLAQIQQDKLDALDLETEKKKAAVAEQLKTLQKGMNDEVLKEKQKALAIEKITAESEQKKSEIKQVTARQELQLTADTLKMAADLFAQNTAAYKVLAIAQASIATYLAATKAFAEVPSPFNWIQSALIVAAGLANVAKIAGIGFFTGGYTGDGDRAKPAGITHGQEMVFNADNTAKNRSHFEIIHAQNLTLEDYAAKYLMPRTVLAQMPVADGGSRMNSADVSVLRDEIRGLRADVRASKALRIDRNSAIDVKITTDESSILGKIEQIDRNRRRRM